MELIEFALKLKDWAFTLHGFLILCSLAAFSWAARLGIHHLIDNVRARRIDREKRLRELEDQVATMRAEVDVALFECRADSAMDQSFIETLRGLFTELRAVTLAATGGQHRALPPEIAEIDSRFSRWRNDRHDEKNRRIIRAREQMERARAQLDRAQAQQRFARAA